MTNFERIKSMTIDEMAEWLDKNLVFDGSEAMTRFNERYCSKCEPIVGKPESFNKEVEYCYCELEDKCKFFPNEDGSPSFAFICKLWLMEEEKKKEKK